MGGRREDSRAVEWVGCEMVANGAQSLDGVGWPVVVVGGGVP